MTDFQSDYADLSKVRGAAKANALMAQLKQQIATEDAAQQQANQAAQQAPAKVATATPQEATPTANTTANTSGDGPGFLDRAKAFATDVVGPALKQIGAGGSITAPADKFVGRAELGGATDAGASLWNLGNDAVKYLSDKLFDHKMQGVELESKIPQPTGTADRVARGVAQFALPFSGAMKVVDALPVLAKAPSVIKAMTAGAAVDYSAFSPEEKNAVNTLQEVFGSNPVLNNAYMDFLKASPDDSHALARAKNALIGLHLGAATDMLFAGMRAAKGFLGPRAADVWSSLTKADAAEKAIANPPVVTPVAKAAAVAAQPVPTVPTLQENVKSLIERRTGQATATKSAAAQRRADTELTYTDPLNRAKLDQWETAAKEAEASKATEAAQAATQASQTKSFLDSAKAFMGGGADNTQSFKKFHLDGEAPLIGHADDPMVHELDHDIGEALGLSTPEVKAAQAEAVPGFARTAEQKIALNAYAKLQDAALETFKRNFEQLPKGTGRVFSDEARQFLKAYSASASKGLTDEARQALVEQGVKASGLSSVGRTESGAVAPSGLVGIIHSMDKGQVASGLGGAALTAAGAAGAEDGEGSEGHSAQDIVMGALAGFAAYKLHGGVKAFMQRKGLQAVHPVADELARPGVEGLTAPTGATADTLPKARIDAMTDAAMGGSYRDLAKKVNTSDFNFSRYNTGEDVKKMVDAYTGQFAKEFDQAKRGTVSLAQTQEHADTLGVSMDTFKAMHENTANLDATITAHRAVFAAHAQHVVEVARIAATTGTDASILAARQAVARQATIQAYMKSSQTEIARAMSAMRIVSGEGNMVSKEMSAMVEALGGKEANMDFMRRLADLDGDVESLTKVARKSALARTSDALFESFVSGILSGPSSQVANLAGNIATALWSGVERQTAVGFSKVAGRELGEGVTQTEVNSYISGMVQGFGASLRVSSAGRAGIAEAAGLFLKGQQDAAMGVIQRNADEMGGFWTALLSGESKAPGQAMDFMGSTLNVAPRVPAISSQGLHLDSDSYLGQAVDYLGAAMRTPLRALGAADDVFKSAYYYGELHAQATRDGLSKGLKDKDLYEHIAQFVESPSRTAQDSATTAANKGTFSNPLGDKMRWATDLQRNLPLARWVLPIIKTPMNVVAYVGERTPMLRTYSDAVKADLEAGGARADIANARLAAASMLYLSGFSLAASGLFTGGGDTNQKAENLSGPGQYSLKVGDQWIAINRMAPLGMFLGLSADMYNLKDHWSEHEAPALVGAAILSLSRNITSQTMTAGLSDLVDALNQAQRGNTDRLSQWGNTLTSSVATPFSSLLRTLAREDDPYAKEVWTLADAFKARIPGYSKDVFNKVDALGNDVVAKTGAFPVTQDSEDPAARELRRLNVDLKPLPKGLRVADGMPAIDLTPQQYYRLQKLHGEMFKGALTDAISSPEWGSVPESRGDLENYKSQKDMVIKLLHQTTRQAANGKLFQEFPELQDKARMVMAGRPH